MSWDIFFKFFFNVFIYFWDRERQSMSRGGAEREGDTDLKQAPGSALSAQSPTRGLNSRTASSWPGWSRTLNRLRHPGAPIVNILKILFQKKFFYVYLFLRQSDRVRAREGQRERETQIWSRLQALSCQHRVRCRAWTHKLWDHDLSLNQESDVELTEPFRCPYNCSFFFFLKFIYFWEREQAQAGEGQRERETQIWSRLQALTCQHRAWCRARTQEPWDHDLSRSQALNLLSHFI